MPLIPANEDGPYLRATSVGSEDGFPGGTGLGATFTAFDMGTHELASGLIHHE